MLVTENWLYIPPFSYGIFGVNKSEHWKTCGENMMRKSLK